MVGAATFGWLCVETSNKNLNNQVIFAATFGWLCVETLDKNDYGVLKLAATFGWLCVETLFTKHLEEQVTQPPSGGCVLKLASMGFTQMSPDAATFGWLCVETLVKGLNENGAMQPPSGGCVLKRYYSRGDYPTRGSHLRVAVC